MSIKFPRVKAILHLLLIITIFLNFTNVAFAAPGDLDLTFDMDGKVTTDFNSSIDHARAVAMQADGKIVVAGAAIVDGVNYDFALARYNANGSLDTTFSADGKVTTALSTGVDEANAVTIQPDGKIIAAGRALTNGSDDFALARYNTDGSLDNTFDTDGKVTTDFGSNIDQAQAVKLQPDGKIVVAGRAVSNGLFDFALARYNADGSPDTTFDTDGKMTTAFGTNNDEAYAVALQTDGKIVAAGGVFSTGKYNFALARYNSDGSLDTSFDTDGKVTTSFNLGGYDFANAVVLQPDGKIVTAGTVQIGTTFTDFGLARYNTNGSLDTTFDTDGKLTTAFGTADDEAFAVAAQANGKIVAAGSAIIGSAFQFALALYNTDGSLDTNFSADGEVTTAFGSNEDRALGVALQTDGKIVAAGFTTVGSTKDFALARYTGDPVANRRTPFDFDGDGKTDISIFRPSAGEWWYLRSSDGQNRAFQFGSSSDKLTPADFTGDGKTDVAFWRPSTGEWFILRSEDGSYYSFPFGASGDIPVVGDFDADGKSDATIYRPSDSTWYINKSSGGTTIQRFGQTGDVPIAADYDGDNKTDIAIYRVSLGEWWIQRSTAGLIALQFGNNSDKPVQGDYTGDGKADVALFRPSTGEWFVLRSENQSYYSFPFGLSGDTPSPGDYDGDGKFDATVFRSSNSTWFSNRTTAGTLIQGFGQSGDRPVPNAFVP